MFAESSILSRARTFGAALLLTLFAAPALTVLAPTAASAAPYGQLVINEAARYYGTPYSYGATGPGSFDCSGFTGFIYAKFGVNLPRTSADQYNALPHVAQDQKQIGDLVFMYDAGGIYHVGIYAGGNTLWAATHTGDVVRPEAIWTSSYLVARPVLGGAIGQHWQDLGGANSVLGQALNLEYAAPGARKVDYQFGDIYWTPTTGAHEVHGALVGLYDRTGGSGGFLGVPLTDEYAVHGGRANRFSAGAAYWSPATNEHEVHGAIGLKYDAMGGPDSLLGLPLGDEGAEPGGRSSGFFGGVVYWSPTTGAVEVHGAILSRYRELGGAGGALGLPVSDERDAVGGRESAFQHGVLRWNARTGVVRLIAS